MGAPRTVEEMRQIARVNYSPADAPRLLADIAGLWQSSGEATTIEQSDVDPFVGSIGDENPIHRCDFRHPLVPGMMTASSLPRFLARNVPIFSYGFAIIFEHIEADFTDFVFVGESVCTSYLVLHPEVAGRSALLRCEFSIQVRGVAHPACLGKMRLRLVEQKFFDAVIDRAARRLPATISPRTS